MCELDPGACVRASLGLVVGQLVARELGCVARQLDLEGMCGVGLFGLLRSVGRR